MLTGDYLEARGSDDHPLCYCEDGQWMTMMVLLMALASDRMQQQSSATAMLGSSTVVVANSDSNGR